MYLTERDLIDKVCLIESLKYDLGHVDVSTVSAILLRLGLLDKGFENDSDFPGYYSFSLPHWWLATMLVRGGCNAPNKLFSIIEWTDMFRHFNTRKFPRLSHYTGDPLACSNGNRNGLRFGEWLPQGLGEDRSVWPDAIHKCLARLWEVERVWKSNYNGFSQPEYLLEDEQDTHLSSDSEVELERKYSRVWKLVEPDDCPFSGRSLHFN